MRTAPHVVHLSHVPALDGVRGLAIVAILLFHNFHVPGGWAGVDLFFALSGFLIVRILTATRGEADYFSRFYWRRTVRIFPPYYALLVVLVLIDSDVRERAWWYALYLSDFVFAAPRMDTPTLHHTWSLAVEEQFYLVIPPLARWLPPPTFRWTVLGAAVVPSLVRVAALTTGASSFLANYNIAARCDGLLLGAALGSIAATHGPGAISTRTAGKVIMTSAGIVVALILLGKFSVSTTPSLAMYVLGLPSLAAGGAALVWVAFSHRGIPARILARPELRWLGRISYGLYLYHQPILIYAERRWPAASLWERGVHGLLTSAVAAGVAWLSWRFFEQPLSRFKDRGAKHVGTVLAYGELPAQEDCTSR